MSSPDAKLIAHVQDVQDVQKQWEIKPLGYSTHYDMREAPGSCSLSVHPSDGKYFAGSGMQRIKLFTDRGGSTTQRFVGRTDERDGSTGDSSRSLTIPARDMSLHLTDNDAPIGSVKNETLKHFAERCIGQFGIGDFGEFSFVLIDAVLETYKMAGRKGGKRSAVFVGATTPNKKDWRVQPNTPCWQAISKFAAQVGVVPWMRDQALCLTRPNYKADPNFYGPGIIMGGSGTNALSSDLRLSSANRHAVYRAKTKATTKGPEKTVTVGGKQVKKATSKTTIYRGSAIDPSPAFWNRIDTTVAGPGVDPLIARFGLQSGATLADRHARVKEIRGDWYGDETLMKRALRTEMETQALDGWEYTVTVQGLTAPNGTYWTTDTMVSVLDTTHDGFLIDRPLYIVALDEVMNEGDTEPTVTLQLIPPNIWLFYDFPSDTAYTDAMMQEINF